jgi:hypothetical protein
MITGNVKKINIGTSFFEKIISEGSLYVDKTKFIENFLNDPSDVKLITRCRRLGKSLNMDTLRCFLTDLKDYRDLFKGLYIEKSPAWEKVNSAPALNFNFKNLSVSDYKEGIFMQILGRIYDYLDDADVENLEGYEKIKFAKFLNSEGNAEGLRFLKSK